MNSIGAYPQHNGFFGAYMNPELYVWQQTVIPSPYPIYAEGERRGPATNIPAGLYGDAHPLFGTRQLAQKQLNEKILKVLEDEKIVAAIQKAMADKKDKLDKAFSGISDEVLDDVNAMMQEVEEDYAQKRKEASIKHSQQRKQNKMLAKSAEKFAKAGKQRALNESVQEEKRIRAGKKAGKARAQAEAELEGWVKAGKRRGLQEDSHEVVEKVMKNIVKKVVEKGEFNRAKRSSPSASGSRQRLQVVKPGEILVTPPQTRLSTRSKKNLEQAKADLEKRF
jgi:hypothetical protein